jgi:hypothetical protein
MGRFEKGKKRPPNAGRKVGSINKTTSVLREAVLLAGQQTGDLPRGHDGLVGYLRFVAREYPPAFVSLLARALPQQVLVHAQTEVTYRSVAEIGDEMASRGFPLDEIAPLLTQVRPIKEEVKEEGGDSGNDQDDNDA